jgi:dienelactone hydrolase
MHGTAVYHPHQEEPSTVRLFAREAMGPWAGLRARSFEFVSRGDFVPGLLYQPPEPPIEQPADTPGGRFARGGRDVTPLLLVQHDARASKQARSLECVAPWVHEGLSVAAIDLPLHGERSSPKLTERLCAGFEAIERGDTLDAQTRVLVEEFARQSTSDLMRGLDALSVLPGIDPDRIAFLGFGLGATVGSYLLAHDRRPRAAVLAFAGGGADPADLDPAMWLARAENPPTLIVAARNDARAPERTSRALFESAREPRSFTLCSGSRATGLDDGAVAEARSFLWQALSP